jgi:DNA-binding beta-propeller fold protein YncE
LPYYRKGTRSQLLDAVTDSVLAVLHDSTGILLARHFAISPDGQRVAAALPFQGSLNGLAVADLATLTAERRYEFAGLFPEYVAYSPDNRILYVLASDHLLVVDADSGEVLQDYNLGPDGCMFLCVANPAATSRDGRWVVFAQEARAIFIDTNLHVPFIAGPLGSGVAASPVRDEFYFVDGAGVVTRVGPPETDAD